MAFEESQHWYTADGQPMHSVLKADKKGMTPTTLRHARKLNLYPSVTSILGVLAKPQLDIWKAKQITTACFDAMNNGDGPGLPDEYHTAMMDRAFQQVTDAADAGTLIHNALERVMGGLDYDESEQVFLPQLEHTFNMSIFVEPVVQFMEQEEIRPLFQEKAIVNTVEGFAGMADLGMSCKRGTGILDYKTRKTNAKYPVAPYDGQPMQIAAYAKTEFKSADSIGCNLYISTTEPGRVVPCWYTAEEVAANYKAFCHLTKVWQFLKNYTPEA